MANATSIRRPNRFSPGEVILTFHETSFDSLGLNFNPLAPYAGCRLCGAVFQSDYDRLTLMLKDEGKLYFNEVLKEWDGTKYALKVKTHADELRENWRKDHRRANHTDEEVEAFNKTGLSVTPEAAHKLAPMGFAPSENRHEEIVDAMATAPRAPYDDCEG